MAIKKNKMEESKQSTLLHWCLWKITDPHPQYMSWTPLSNLVQYLCDTWFPETRVRCMVHWTPHTQYVLAGKGHRRWVHVGGSGGKWKRYPSLSTYLFLRSPLALLCYLTSVVVNVYCVCLCMCVRSIK